MVYLQYNRNVQDVYIPRQNQINVEKTGIDLSMYLTSGQTVELIEEATENLITSGDVQEQIDSSLSGYATEQWVESQGYLTEHQSLSAYSTTEEMNSAISAATDDMATKTWVGQQGYLTEHQSLSAYSTTEQVEGMISAATEDFITSADAKTQIESYNYITASDLPDVSNYVTSADVKTQVEEYNYVNSGQVQTQIDNSISGITIDLSDYYTSAQTESAIQEATENFVTSGEVQTQIDDGHYFGSANGLRQLVQNVTLEYDSSNDRYIKIDKRNYTGSNGTLNSIKFAKINGTSVVGGYTDITLPTSADVKTQVESYNYVNSGQVQTQIENSLSGVDLSNYYTSGETDSLITSATEDLVTSGDVKIQIEDYGYITAEDIPTSNTAFTNDAGYITSAATEDFVTSADVKTQIESYNYITASDLPDVSNYVTSADVKTQVEEYNYITSADAKTQIEEYNYVNSGQVQTQIENSLSGVDLSNYYTSGETDNLISEAVSGKQDTLISGTNIKTINNESILGSGNITIQGGGGSGGETVVELTKAQYEALTAYSQDTTYIITDADVIDITDYATSADTAALSGAIATVSAATDTKADKATVSANNAYYFAAWNNQGIITGTTGNRMYQRNININGSNQSVVRTTNSDMGTIYAPTTAGSAGQLVTSNGSGAPVWTSFKFWYGTQNDYDAITTKDSTTIYFITD